MIYISSIIFNFNENNILNEEEWMLRKMKYFVTVCETRNFTKAAQLLHVSQPSITSSIAKLENELGLMLLKRNHHQVELTKEGELFYERAVKVLRDVNDMIEEFKDRGRKSERTLNLAISTSIGESWLFSVVYSKYADKYPDVHLNIQGNSTKKILESIDEGLMEVGFVALDEKMLQYEIVPFSHGEVFVLLPRNHRFSKMNKISLSWLENEQCILASGSNFIYKKIADTCKKYNIDLNIIFSSFQFITVFNMVARGMGISFVLSDDIAIIKNNPQISICRLEEPIKFNTGFIYAKKRYLSKTAREFINFITALDDYFSL